MVFPLNILHTRRPETKAFIDQEVKNLLETGRVVDVTEAWRRKDDKEALRVLPLLVHDNGRKKRLCYDARQLNRHIFCETFRMETVATAARLMRKGDWAFTLDHFNGFHQLRLQKTLKQHCCFRWGGRVYRWEVL